MKKIILTIAIAISSFLAFANETNVSAAVQTAFSREFAGAKEVSWTSGTGFYKASFVYNEQHVAAFYSYEGEMLGLARNIRSLDLPMSLQRSLKKEYGGRWITELFEMSNAEGTSYYITLEQADSKVILKSENGSQWSVYKKSSKA
ncbi:hypothetical protein LZZ85_17755 [Terrimonas sp. NA20]|uniref:Beta-lactamase-inhibitor-like PepSY-like domain-containing protein n=1 Tax=Terrimonas ginsenosidimutans TaxID=2908004 RepID=A0ABS9KUX7_9BACT|nr:hypothetical protein [Terrimonas ginsenosidimutans]MCG2616147.1 hypothetical protein [Terrimonas ginsenosidimutans]